MVLPGPGLTLISVRSAAITLSHNVHSLLLQGPGRVGPHGPYFQVGVCSPVHLSRLLYAHLV
jgi:hypothetical protein